MPLFPAPDQDLQFTTTATLWGAKNDTLHLIIENSSVCLCVDGSHHHSSSSTTSTLHGTLLLQTGCLPFSISMPSTVHRTQDLSTHRRATFPQLPTRQTQQWRSTLPTYKPHVQ